MTAISLDGKSLAAELAVELASQVKELKNRGIAPGLGTILVGADPASEAYIAAKHRACEEVGVASIHAQLGDDVSTADVLEVVRQFNADLSVHAFIVQLPMPPQVDEEAVLLAMDPGKDADGLHPVSLGKLVMGVDAPLPCTPRGIQMMLVHYGVEISGKHVVIVGRGLTIGRPLALLLALKREHANAAVTVIHTGVGDLGAYTREADIVIAAAGRPSLIMPDMVRPGAAVVGAGITRDGRRIISDVDESVGEVAGWITPRLGGVGPMTVAMLLRNTVDAAARQ
ncbi:MAG: bifunctional 5,10-methylenetetrahydrofolate dehydrogenase/5,10-methenyltetrahydrofolate cyclohydrolase [Acidimicrobiales bacterium]